MKQYLLLLSTALATQLVVAQNTNQLGGQAAERNFQNLKNPTSGSMVYTYDNRYEGIKGTPYFSEDWQNATITVNNLEYDQLKAKYNVYEKNLLIKRADEKVYILEASQISSFILKNSANNQIYTFKKLDKVVGLEPRVANDLFMMLHEGEKAQLVSWPEKAILKANYQGAYSANRPYDEFKSDQHYYFIGKDKSAQKIKLNKKTLLKLLKDKEQQIANFIKKQHIDETTEVGWIKALMYYETL